MGKPGRHGKSGKPAGKPEHHGKSMEQVLAERAKHERENMGRRRGKLEHLVGSVEPPQAMFLLQDPRNFHSFVQEHNVRAEELEALKSMLRKKAGQ